MKALTTESYDALKEELEALRVEAKFDITVRAIEWAHKTGEIIRDFTKDTNITPLLTRLAVDTGISERTLYRRVELFDKHPNLKKAMDEYGKNVTMRQLMGGDKKEEIERQRCSECGRLTAK